MQREIIYDSIEKFIEALKAAGIGKVAMAETKENRILEVEPNKLQVTPVIIADLLAYKKPSIFKCTIPNADFEEINSRLLGEGFEVNRTSRNII